MALELYPGLPALGAVIERLKHCSRVDEVVVATTTHASDDLLVSIAKDFKASYFRGSQDDVLGRVVSAAGQASAQAVVLVTGDCSCISPQLIDEGVTFFLGSDFDLVSNCLEDSYPVGIDLQVVRFEALRKSHEMALTEPYCRDTNNFEHTNYFIKTHPGLFRIYRYPAPGKYNRPDIQLALDTADDLEVMRRIYRNLYPQKRFFDIDDLLELFVNKPAVLDPLKGRCVDRTGIKQ